MGKRRTFTPGFKLEAVLDMIRGEKTVAQICRQRESTESWLYKWLAEHPQQGKRARIGQLKEEYAGSD
jgi:transposase-like protein